MQIQQKQKYGIFVLLISVLLFTACCIVIFMDYNWLVNRIVTGLQKPAIENLLRQKALTAQKFRWVQYCCGAGLVLVPLFATVLIRKADTVITAMGVATGSLHYGYKSVIKVFVQNSTVQNISIGLVMLLIFAKSLYYINAWDLQYDEMWCYNYLTARPFYFTLFSYNNYPLFELSTQLSRLLPFSMKVDLRLPVVITGILSCLLLYACLIKYFYSHAAALGGLVVYGFMPVTTIYMLYARGVIFESFFAIAALFSLIFWLKTGYRNFIILFSAANAAGMYSMPTHGYFWAILFMTALPVLLLQRKQSVRAFLLANGCAALLSCLLYIPVLAGSGLSFVIEATKPHFEYSQIFPNIPAFIFSYSKYYTGFTVGMACIVALAAGYLFCKKGTGDRVLLPVVLLLCFFPLIVYVTQRLVVPYRASGFVSLAVPLIFAMTVQRLQNIISEQIIYALLPLTGTVMFIVSHYHSELNWSRKRDREAVELSSLFMHEKVRTVYDKSVGSGFFYFYPAIEYYYRVQHKDLDFFVAATNSIRYKPLRLKDNYDCIIYRSDGGDSSFPEHYELIYADTALKYKVMLRK